jgi:hypothetical protein
MTSGSRRLRPAAGLSDGFRGGYWLIDRVGVLARTAVPHRLTLEEASLAG